MLSMVSRRLCSIDTTICVFWSHAFRFASCHRANKHNPIRSVSRLRYYISSFATFQNDRYVQQLVLLLQLRNEYQRRLLNNRSPIYNVLPHRSQRKYHRAHSASGPRRAGHYRRAPLRSDRAAVTARHWHRRGWRNETNRRSRILRRNRSDDVWPRHDLRYR